MSILSRLDAFPDPKQYPDHKHEETPYERDARIARNDLIKGLWLWRGYILTKRPSAHDLERLMQMHPVDVAWWIVGQTL